MFPIMWAVKMRAAEKLTVYTQMLLGRSRQFPREELTVSRDRTSGVEERGQDSWAQSTSS